MEKERDKNKIKRRLFALFTACVLTVFSICPVFASDTGYMSKYKFDNDTYNISVSSSLFKTYPYIYITKGGDNLTLVYILTNKIYASRKGSKALNINDSTIGYKFYKFYNTTDLVINDDKKASSYGSFPFTEWRETAGTSCFDIGSLEFSNININYADSVLNDDGTLKGYKVSTDDFFIPKVPVVAEAAVELPAVVKSQAVGITTVAVCCLALLICSITLLPRLKIFLN